MNDITTELKVNQQHMKKDINDINSTVMVLDRRLDKHEKEDERRFTKIETTIKISSVILMLIIPLITSFIIKYFIFTNIK